MDEDQLNAARVLIDFARTHAEDVYLDGIDDDEELKDAQINFDDLHLQADILENYLDQ